MPAWRRVLAQFQDPLVYLLLGAIVVALVAWLIEGREGLPVDAIVIAMVVVANAVLGFVQEARAANAVAALARMTAVTSSVLRDGERRRIPSAELVPGDILLLEEGDAVGADGRLLLSASLRVQEASLTGESEAVLKDAAPLNGPAPLAERSCMVFKGTAVVQGTGRAVITATGMQTEMGAIATMLDATVEQPTPLQKEVALIGRTLGIAVVVIAVIVVATVLLVSDIKGPSDVITVLLLGVSLAVAAVPEGLPAILSLVLALGVQRMAKRNAVVKTLSSVETLGSASVICSDKTGTLTRSEMTIERIMTASGGSRVTGVGYAPLGRLEVEGGVAPEGALRAEQIVVLSGGSLAGNAALRQAEDGAWEIQGDPTEAAFLVAERKLGVEDRRQRRFERIGEIPFSSERKMMSTIELDHEHGGERILITKGAPDVLMGHCNRIRVGMDVVPFDEAQRAHAHADVERLSDEALRTLAVAYRPLGADEDPQASETLEHDLIFVGTVGIIDPPREEAAVAIAAGSPRRHPGHDDHRRPSTHRIAHRRSAGHRRERDEGTDRSRTGRHGRCWFCGRGTGDLGLCPRGARAQAAHRRCAAGRRQCGGDDWRRRQRRSGVEGSGYRRRHGDHRHGSHQGGGQDDPGRRQFRHHRRGGARRARHLRQYPQVPPLSAVVQHGRGSDRVPRRRRGRRDRAGWRDGGELVLPLLATQILWINLITDSGPALAMGIDPETDDVMARPPRKANERAIDARMWRGVIEIGLVMALATLLTIDLYLPGGLIEGSQSLDQARTAGFTVLVLAQLFNCFNARSETTSAFRHMFTNRWLWAAIGLSVLLQIAVVNFGPLNVAFGTVPLPLEQWLVCVAMGSSVLWFGEIRKWALRRWGTSLHSGLLERSPLI